MSNADWSRFTVHDRRGQPLALAALCGFLYFDRCVHAIAAGVADGIERYVQYVGPDVLSVYTAASGYWKPWTARQLSKDLRRLRSLAPDLEGARIHYDSAPVPGGYGAALTASLLDEQTEARWANLFRVDLPADWLDTHPVEQVVAFFQQLFDAVGPDSANVGLAFKRTEGTKHEATRGVHAMLARFLGFDPCYSNIRDDMRGHTFTAHWLNFLGPQLAQRLGGAEAIGRALGSCEVRPLGRGVFIRGAELPPIGDVNRGAPDLGCLPDVARLLRPTRVSIHAFGEPHFDADAWLARLDELPCRSWSNRGVS